MKEIAEQEKLSWIERQAQLATERLQAKVTIINPEPHPMIISQERSTPTPPTVYGFDGEIQMGRALVKAAHGLNIHEIRLIRYAISKIHPTAVQPSELIVKVAANDYAKRMELDASRNFYRDLKKAADSLFDRYIKIDRETPTGRITDKIHWVRKATYHHGEGWVELHFDKEVSGYLSMLKDGNKIVYQIQNLIDLKSVYSVRLFELLMQWQDTKRLLITVDDLRKALEVPEKYTFGVMKVNCIDHPISELKKLGKLDIQYTAVKDKDNKRRVGSLEFRWKPVEQIEIPLEGGETPKKPRGRKPKEA